jgi:hypothetical protein
MGVHKLHKPQIGFSQRSEVIQTLQRGFQFIEGQVEKGYPAESADEEAKNGTLAQFGKLALLVFLQSRFIL